MMPRAIALVRLDTAAASAWVLADFEDAYRAYAEDTAATFGLDAVDLIPAFVHIAAGDSAAAAADTADACDVAVLACVVQEDGGEEATSVAFASVLPLLAKGCRVYVIAIAPGYDPASRPALASLRKACEAGGRAWMGGVMVGGGALMVRLTNAPRMGVLRHRLSEAIDALVMAVRAGEETGEMRARLGLPRPLFTILRSHSQSPR